MAEEFQGGVCGTTAWWNPPMSSSLFSGSLTSPCSVAQLGGSYDMPTFGWPNEVLIKGNNNDNNRVVNSFDNSSLDILGFGLSPTSSIITDWSHPNSIINNGENDVNYDSVFMEDGNYNMNSSPNITNSTNISCHDNLMNNYNSPPQATSGDSTSNTRESGLIPNSTFQLSSTASYLIQTLFEDIDDPQVLEPQLPISPPINNSNYGYGVMDSSHELMSSPNITPIQNSMQLGQNNECHGGMNGQYSTATSLRSKIHASLLNSLKSRSRAPTQSCAYIATNKANMEEVHDSNGNMNNHPPAKRPRIETPSSLPSFKVRKEKLGDRITALQQLVSPFGKTDTASVLHEAIEYIKFLHDQVNTLSSPCMENGAPMQHHKEYKEGKEDLRSGGLCLVPISSTFPFVQETSVDFWTPTFGGQEFT